MLKIKGDYIAAISGGPDSMALLDIYKKNIKCVCHVNYNFRKDSSKDTNIVKKYCHKNQIKLFIKTIKPTIYIDKPFKNFEDWARKVRYEFFLEIAKKLKLSSVLVAHHLDDFLETAIMQYEKCSKTLFFGIKKNSNYKSLKILRPFINCRKSELVDYCSNNNISFALDSTNKDISYKRNMIRKRIEKFSKQEFLKEVKKFHSLNKSNEKIRNKSETLYRRWEHSNFSCKKFINIKCHTLQRELIYKLLIEHFPKRISINKIDAIIQFIKSAKGGSLYRISSSIKFLKKNDLIYFIKYS